MEGLRYDDKAKATLHEGELGALTTTRSKRSLFAEQQIRHYKTVAVPLTFDLQCQFVLHSCNSSR